MSESVKNTYVFGDKFRNQNGDIYWRDLYLYPYDYRKSTVSFIYGFFKSPFTWYLIGFHLLAPGFMNFNTITNTTYIHTILFSYFLFLLILAIHIILYGYIMDPALRDVESKLGNTQKIKRIKSYRNIIRNFIQRFQPTPPPTMTFLPVQSRRPFMWWKLSPEIIVNMANILGFEKSTITYHKQIEGGRTVWFYTVVCERTVPIKNCYY